MGGRCMTGRPDAIEQRLAGRAAHHAGQPLCANPWAVDCDDRLDWETGWRQGEAEWAPA